MNGRLLSHSHRGAARRREVHAETGLPREGTVSIFEVHLHNGEWRLEVEAAWRGVPVGAPPVSPDSRPGIARETVAVGADHELARALAAAAADELRALKTPDLVHGLALLRRRRMGGAQQLGEDRPGG
jgi:hypothetical protein